MEQNNEFNPYAAPTMVEPIQVLGSAKTLHQVAGGFNLVYWALVCKILVVVVMVFAQGAIFRAAAQPGGAIAAGLILAVVVQLVILAIDIMELVGKFMCLAVPPETRARELIVASVVCTVIAMIARLIVQLLYPSVLLALMSVVLTFAGFSMFLIFIKRIAAFIARPDLVDRAQTVIVICIVMVVLIVLAFAMAFGLQALPLLVLGGLAFLVVGIVFLVFYARLLVDSRKAILGIH